MKNLLKISLATTIAIFITGCTATTANTNMADYSKLDVKKECDVKANGVEKVITTAAKYNEIAVKNGVEFMRFGMKTSQYIDEVNKSLKAGSKNIDIIDAKKKKTGEMPIEYGAWRACSFAISALIQEQEAKTTWKLAVPGDGYKY